jgi:two-component system, OmpR family, alkaline phosphatase synthesis response regulator PhoP
MKQEFSLAQKILVVDDEPSVRSLLAEFFTPLGYQVITTDDGDKALELAAREEPDVVLLDVVMPGLDGAEVCKALRASERTAPIPVIMMTGFAGAVIDVSQSAPDDLVLKPFLLSDLLKRVRAIIPIRHVTNRLERMLAYLDELDKNHSD